MKHNIIIYHGSQNVISVPVFGKGNVRNDYGIGFYCTESLELAKGWACAENKSGYANRYQLELTGLSVLNLSDSDYNILNWLSILLKNRIFKVSNDIAEEGREYLFEHFLPAYGEFDVIIGYRADDSYFSFANAFLNNTLSLEQLKRAMYLGKLGEQIVLKSKAAFRQIVFDEALPAERKIYYPKEKRRDAQARAAYRQEREKRRASDAVYLLDILREEWKEDDPRLRRNVSQ